MKPQDALGWFGAIAAIAATVALGSGGWDRWKAVSAVLLLTAAIAILMLVYWERIVAWATGENSDDIRRAVVSDAEAIYSIASRHFGDRVTTVDEIRSIIRKHRNTFWVLFNTSNNGTIVAIEGYACIFPLSHAHIKEIENLTFSVGSLGPANLPRGKSNIAAVYIGGMAGDRFRAKAKMLGFVEGRARDAASRSSNRCVYAKAVTKNGLRVIKHKKFSPVHSQHDGLECFFRKQL